VAAVHVPVVGRLSPKKNSTGVAFEELAPKPSATTPAAIVNNVFRSTDQSP
jgi:hypothetical protein